MKTEAKYGNLPEVIGRIELPTNEMMLWLYCPISVKGDVHNYTPSNLQQYESLLEVVKNDLGVDVYKDKYIYLTVKTTFISAGAYTNRPGWHSDGFMTDDVNYIWYSHSPTEFVELDELVSFSADHLISMEEMETVCDVAEGKCRYPSRLLLKLDESVLHRPTRALSSGMRTFIKVSVSEHKYEHLGNSVNHLLTDVINPCKFRGMNRNCPVTEVL